MYIKSVPYGHTETFTPTGALPPKPPLWVANATAYGPAEDERMTTKLPLFFIALYDTPTSPEVVALGKSGDVAKDSKHTIRMIRSDGRIALSGSEQWHKMDNFAWAKIGTKAEVAIVTVTELETPANDN